MGLPEYRRAGAGQLVVKGGGVAILVNILVRIVNILVLLVLLIGLLKDLHGMGRSMGVRGHLVASAVDLSCYVDKLPGVENL